MALSRFAFVRCVSAAVAIMSGALAYTIATAERLTEAILAFVQAALIPNPPHFAFAPAAILAPVLGRTETRAYHARRLQRSGDQRSRAPDSMAFVGRL